MIYFVIFISLLLANAILIIGSHIHTVLADKKRADRIKQGEDILTQFFNSNNIKHDSHL